MILEFQFAIPKSTAILKQLFAILIFPFLSLSLPLSSASSGRFRFSSKLFPLPLFKVFLSCRFNMLPKAARLATVHRLRIDYESHDLFCLAHLIRLDFHRSDGRLHGERHRFSSRSIYDIVVIRKLAK